MTVQESFEILRIDLSATDEEIKKAYHKLSLENHPDVTKDGDEERQKLLNEASEVALAYAKLKHTLVPLNVATNTFSIIEQNIKETKYKSETKSYIKRLEITKTNNLQRVKYFLWVATAILAFITFFSKEVIPDVVEEKALTPSLKILPLMTGCIALLFQLILDGIKNKLELISESFEDKHYCALKLSEYLGFKNPTNFQVNDLHRIDGNSENPLLVFSMLSGTITNAERIKILILKAKENSLIEPVNTKEINPNNLNAYKLNFNPADFGFSNENREIKVRTADEINQGIKSGFIMSIIFAVITALVIYFFKSYWSILPGVFSLGAILMSLDESKELKKLKKSEAED